MSIRTLVCRLAAATATSFLALTAPAFAGSAWDDIKPSVFGTTPINDGRGVVTLTAENRPLDMRVVPIAVKAGFSDGRTVKKVTVLIDENPTPVVAVFTMGPDRDQVTLTANFRVDRQSDVRAVVEASDGKLYMVEQLIKFAGGQASCSAPPTGDPQEILASMGQMKLDPVVAADASASSALQTAKLTLRHPNHTGMVMDQQTLLYTPMKMVNDITVKSGDMLLFKAEGSIALSQDPMIAFDFKRTAAANNITVTFSDTDGASWTKSFPIGPQS
jgi:sulfur-oxidizing protein SoxY